MSTEKSDYPRSKLLHTYQCECGSSRPWVNSARVNSAWSHIKPTFSMLGNVFNKKSLFNKDWREGCLACPILRNIYLKNMPLIPFDSIPYHTALILFFKSISAFHMHYLLQSSFKLKTLVLLIYCSENINYLVCKIWELERDKKCVCSH